MMIKLWMIQFLVRAMAIAGCWHICLFVALRVDWGHHSFVCALNWNRGQCNRGIEWNGIGSIYCRLFVGKTAFTWTVRGRAREASAHDNLQMCFRPKTHSPFHHVNNFKSSVHKLCSKWDQLAQWISFGEYKKSPDKWRKTRYPHTRTHTHAHTHSAETQSRHPEPEFSVF